MLSAFLHHDTLFAEMVEPLLNHVWSQAEVDANVVFQFLVFVFDGGHVGDERVESFHFGQYGSACAAFASS